jgi:hypothetical protein
MRETQRREWHLGIGKRIHTAHKSTSATIWYRHHPDYGKEVRILRCLKKIAGNNINVLLPDGEQIGIPDWMLDEQICGEIRDLPRPCISILALTHLHRLLDAQPLLQSMQSSGPARNLPVHEPEKHTSTAAVPIGKTQTETPKRCDDSMSGTAPSNAVVRDSTGSSTGRGEEQ